MAISLRKFFGYNLVEKLNQLNKQGMDSYDSEDMEIWAIIETIAYD